MKRLLSFAYVFMSILIINAQNIFTTGKVTNATVYFNMAQITQTAYVNAPAGTSEIVIDNVANSINEKTVQIVTPPNVTVLSVQFTTNYGKEYNENTVETKRINDSIKLVRNKIEKLNLEKESFRRTIELLDKNKATYEDNSKEGQPKIDVASLIKLVEYYNTKRLEINDKIYNIDRQQENLNLLITNLDRRLRTSSTQKVEKKSIGKLIVQLMSDKEIKTNIKVSYLANNASWYPTYDLRASNTNSPIDLYYKAMVVQNTGIDWVGAKLTLSSGIPNQNNQAPIFSTWRLDFVSSNYGRSLDRAYKDQRMMMNQIQAIAPSTREVNEEKISSVDAVINENQLSVSFDVDAPYTILSNGKQHGIVLTETKIPAYFKYYAAPKLNNEAFLLAEIKDYSKYNFLPGEANIIFDNVYVGRTLIDPNQTTEILNLSMGTDKRVSIKREKVNDKSETKFLSSYVEKTFTYDITVRNNKKESIELQLKEQYPLSNNKDITVDLLQTDKATNNEEVGVLTWTLKLSPNETKKVRVSYKVKYPKDKAVNL